MFKTVQSHNKNDRGKTTSGTENNECDDSK